MLDPLLAWIRPIVSVITAVKPIFRRGKAERNAGLNPHSSQRNRCDELMDGALQRLGAISPDDSLWEKFVSACGGVVVRPEHFSKPYVREWLSHPDVSPALKRMAQAKLVSAPEPEEDRKTLISVYMDLSGERKSHAESTLFVAVTFLAESTQQAANDPGVAALVQAGIATIHERMDEQNRKQEEIAGREWLGVAAMAEHHGKDAQAVLDAILRKRATSGKDTVNELHKLARSLCRDGEYAGAPLSILENVHDWTARIAASQGMLAEAEEALVALTNMGRETSLVTTAWIEVTRGQIDSSLKNLTSVDTADSRSAILGILRSKKGVTQTLAYLDTLDLTIPAQFTPAGWTNAIGFLAENGQQERATEILSSLTTQLSHTIIAVAPMRPWAREIGPMTLRRLRGEATGEDVVVRNVRGCRVRLFSIERTVIDCLGRPDLCGGMDEARQILLAASRKWDWEKLRSVLERKGQTALNQRLGHTLDSLGVKMPRAFREWLSGTIPARSRAYLVAGRKGHYDKIWRVIA